MTELEGECGEGGESWFVKWVGWGDEVKREAGGGGSKVRGGGVEE